MLLCTTVILFIVSCALCATPTIPGVAFLGQGWNSFTGRDTVSLFNQYYTYNTGKRYIHFMNATETTYAVPDEFEVTSDPEYGIQAYAFSSIEAYAKSEAISIGVDVKVKKYGAFLALSPELERISESMSTEKSRLIIAKEYNDLYRIHLAPSALTPTSLFVNDVKGLPSNYASLNSSNGLQFKSFIEKYGTHFVIDAVIGGSMKLSCNAKWSKSSSFTGLNLKMQVSAGFLNRKFMGADLSMAKLNKDPSEKFAFESSCEFELIGGDVNTNTNKKNWFASWITSISGRPAKSHFRVEPIETAIARISKSAAQLVTRYLDEYSNTLSRKSAKVQAPILLSNCEKRTCLSSTGLNCASTFPLNAISIFIDDDDGSDNGELFVASTGTRQSDATAVGTKPCVSWIPGVFQYQPFRYGPTVIPTVTPVPLLKSQNLLQTMQYSRFGTTEATNHLLPGVDLLGVGFDSLYDVARLPFFSFHYARKRSWTDPSTKITYSIPDEVTITDINKSPVTETSIFSSPKEYQTSLANANNQFDPTLPVFSLSYENEVTRDIFTGSQSVLGVAVKEYESFKLNIGTQAFSDSMLKNFNALPLKYDEDAYLSFIRYYGTHVVMQASYGAQARLWTAISQEFYATHNVADMSRYLGIHLKNFEIGIGYGTSSQSDSIEFSKSSFSWLTFNGGMGNELLSNQWSDWMKSSNYKPAQLGRVLKPIWELLKTRDSNRAKNVETAAREYFSRAPTREDKPVDLQSKIALDYSSLYSGFLKSASKCTVGHGFGYSTKTDFLKRDNALFENYKWEVKSSGYKKMGGVSNMGISNTISCSSTSTCRNNLNYTTTQNSKNNSFKAQCPPGSWITNVQQKSTTTNPKRCKSPLMSCTITCSNMGYYPLDDNDN